MPFSNIGSIINTRIVNDPNFVVNSPSTAASTGDRGDQLVLGDQGLLIGYGTSTAIGGQF